LDAEQDMGLCFLKKVVFQKPLVVQFGYGQADYHVGDKRKRGTQRVAHFLESKLKILTNEINW
jgi:hypothetical protein